MKGDKNRIKIPIAIRLPGFFKLNWDWGSFAALVTLTTSRPANVPITINVKTNSLVDGNMWTLYYMVLNLLAVTKN